MRVKIQTYDQIKGKGTYMQDGKPYPFHYTQFEGEKLIPPGEYAELLNSVLHPVTLPWYLKLWLKIKEVLKWR